ncbi:hypothetical protein ACSBR2_009483 [Camellia fascicularis]
MSVCAQMDAVMMLLCCYRSTNVTYTLQSPYQFATLVDFVCLKFDGLLPGEIILFDKIPGHNNLALQNDIDMLNLVCLAYAFRLQLIDVILKQRWVEVSSPIIDEQLTSNPNVHDGMNSLNGVDMDDELDLLPTFYLHTEKVFLSALWANGFTHIGQHFEGGASEFHIVLLLITAVCAMTESKSCTWFVHGRKLEANEFFYLRRWNSEHICGVAVRTSSNPSVGSELVSDVIVEHVRNRPLTWPTEVILDLKEDYGLDITYRVVWIGVEKARGELFGAHFVSFNQLRWYNNAIIEHNLGSYISLEYDNRNH